MSSELNITVPEGMMEDSKGRFVPISTIKDIDIARNDTVMDVAQSAIELRSWMATRKLAMIGDIKAFIDLSLEQYGVKQGGNKGNVTLTSFDGRYKIQVAQQDNITFDERLQAAKALIDECLHEWTDNSNDNVKVIVNHAFQVDKEGKINTGPVLSLRRLKIDDTKWKRAMDAIGDSIQVTTTKEYVRVYERDDAGEYQMISLDFAGL